MVRGLFRHAQLLSREEEIDGMQTHNRTRALVEGAMLAALLVVLYVLDLYTRILVYIFPVPVAVLVVRHDVRTGVLATVAASLVVSAIVGVISGVSLAVWVGLIGVTLGYCLAKEFKPFPTLVLTSLAVLLATLITVAMAFVVEGVSYQQIAQQFSQAVAQGREFMLAWFKTFKVSQRDVELGMAQFDAIIEFVKITYPALILMSVVSVGAIAYGVSRWVLAKLGYKMPAVPRFSRWRITWPWAWGFILGALLGLLGGQLNSRHLVFLGWNLMMFFYYLFIVQGLAVAWFYIEKYKLDRAGKWAVVLLLLVVPVASPALSYLGLFDSWFDFRKLESRSQGPDMRRGGGTR